MSTTLKLRPIVALGLRALAGLSIFMGGQAQALPSFARQTGMDCVACHIGGFGPQLTPAGIRFKIGGYTDSDGKDGKVPLSAMVVGSWTKTKADQTPTDQYKSNNNFEMDEASVFLAGRVTDNLGTFVQVTRDGVNNKTSLDHVDLRFAKTIDVGGKDTILGVSVNNNPGLQDPFNSMPVWGAPYIQSAVGYGTGDKATLINGGLEHKVTGATAYGFYGNSLYSEIGTYRSQSPTFQVRSGNGPYSDTIEKLGANTYYRLAWFKDLKSQAFHLGVFGWNANLQEDTSSGNPASKYRDIGLDGSYQFLGTRQHVATLNGSYIHERKTDGETASTSRINESRLNATYHYKQTYGAGLGVFATKAPVDGVDEGARGHFFQVDWTPWGKEDKTAPSPFGPANLRLGAQYWVYNKYYNEDSISAKDHNTIYLFAWTSF